MSYCPCKVTALCSYAPKKIVMQDASILLIISLLKKYFLCNYFYYVFIPKEQAFLGVTGVSCDAVC